MVTTFARYMLTGVIRSYLLWITVVITGVIAVVIARVITKPPFGYNRFITRLDRPSVIYDNLARPALTEPLTAKPPTVIHRCNFSLGCAELEFASRPQKARIPAMNIFEKID